MSITRWLGTKVTHGTQVRKVPASPHHPSCLCLCTWKSLSPRPAAALAGLTGLWLAEQQPCGSSPGLRSYFQDPEVLTNRDGLLQRTRQAPMGSDSSCPGPGRQECLQVEPLPNTNKMKKKSLCPCCCHENQRPGGYGTLILFKILPMALVMRGLRLDVGNSSDKWERKITKQVASPSSATRWFLASWWEQNSCKLSLGKGDLVAWPGSQKWCRFLFNELTTNNGQNGAGTWVKSPVATGYRVESQGTWQVFGLSFSSFTCHEGVLD